MFIMLLASVSLSAQTDSSGFYVQSFKKLEWDLDARSNHPMLDQNNRKAALIKVVIPEAGFDFDVGVMGVVSTRQEVGEIWVYVPEGVRKITIRHQTYGVIRDYEFGCPVESASVYEMRLHVPLRPETMTVVKDSIVVRDSIVYVPTPAYTRTLTSVKKWFDVKMRTKWSILTVSNFPDPSVGFMVTHHAHKVGAYFKAEATPRQSGADYLIDYQDGNTIENWDGLFKRLTVTAGGIFRCTNWLGICCGAGYGQYLCYSGYHGGSTDCYRLEDGFTVDVGLMVRLGHFTTYLGGNMNFPYDDHYGLDNGSAFLEFGIGYAF